MREARSPHGWRFLLLCGSGRTGSTALAAMLGQHPQVAAPPETLLFTHALVDQGQRRPWRSWRRALGCYRHAHAIAERHAPALVGTRARASLRFLRRLRAIGGPSSDQRVLRCVLITLIDGTTPLAGKRWVVLQNPLNCLYHGTLTRLLGPWRGVIMKRDLAGFINSCRYGKWPLYASDARAAAHWELARRCCEDISTSIAARVLTLDQDQLRSDSATAVAQVCSLMDLPPGSVHPAERRLNSSFNGIPQPGDPPQPSAVATALEYARMRCSLALARCGWSRGR